MTSTHNPIIRKLARSQYHIVFWCVIALYGFFVVFVLWMFS